MVIQRKSYNNIGYNILMINGNDVKPIYYYNPLNFRITRILTTRNTGQDVLQDLNYTYDAVGNITQVTDNAQQTFYFNNTVIAPTGTYTYDALYRLIAATGRELTSIGTPTDVDFVNTIGCPNPAANAMQTYSHSYAYDQLGNMTNNNGTIYTYATANNQLTLTGYTYDAHGNTLTMPHLTSMGWDYLDQLHSAGNGTFTSYYNYDAEGKRTRKVVDKGTVVEHRYYFGEYEVYDKYVNGVLDTERTTVHLNDEQKRFVIIDTLTSVTPSVVTERYQYDNHLGSSCLELDSSSAIISYEEYHPFGTTSYRSGRSQTEVSLKRYKYCGKERDEETGLYYYGMRYYAAWICRFVSVDPLQFKYPELTPFQYASNTPISAIDLDGAEAYFMSDGTKAGQIGTDTSVRLVNKNIKLEDAQKLINTANRILKIIDPNSVIGNAMLNVINDYSKKNSSDVGMTEAELYTRAFLTLVRQAEAGGTKNRDEVANPLDYNIRYGNFKFDSYSKHPNILYSGPGYSIPSTAAGAYQFTYFTWKSFHFKDISPENQDKGALVLIKRQEIQGKKEPYKIGVINDIKTGNVENAIYKLKGTWPSLPGGSQEKITIDEAKIQFKKNIANELKGITVIKSKKGTLLF
ncbi:MAG: hypothetical protein PHC83_04100 [Bacteroidales bacterium]|nr:hypothetical protein [Bacteroidales bacterium]